jgi:hypothetical protein
MVFCCAASASSVRNNVAHGPAGTTAFAVKRYGAISIPHSVISVISV